MANRRSLRETFKARLVRTRLGAFAYHKLKRIYGTFHGHYSPNNSLGIVVTTECNLRCLNCQTSAKHAPAADKVTVAQVEGFVAEAINHEYYWDRVIVTGGEATLHPELRELLGALKSYRAFNPGCVFLLETNGAGAEVQSRLKELPDWVSVSSSNKTRDDTRLPFVTYTVAPVDTWPYGLFTDFSKGCRRLSDYYGLCLSRYGYYPHSACMNVDRVFGFDIGIKSLSLVNEQALRGQMRILCKYCGWFNEGREELLVSERISPSWRKAFAEYRRQKPILSPYGIKNTADESSGKTSDSTFPKLGGKLPLKQ